MKRALIFFSIFFLLVALLSIPGKGYQGRNMVTMENIAKLIQTCPAKTYLKRIQNRETPIRSDVLHSPFYPEPLQHIVLHAARNAGYIEKKDTDGTFLLVLPEEKAGQSAKRPFSREKQGE